MHINSKVTCSLYQVSDFEPTYSLKHMLHHTCFGAQGDKVSQLVSHSFIIFWIRVIFMRPVWKSLGGILTSQFHPLTQWFQLLGAFTTKNELLTKHKGKMYGLLTKCEVKMAGYWPRSFLACLWTETKLRSINSQRKNKANIQPSWLSKLGQ